MLYKGPNLLLTLSLWLLTQTSEVSACPSPCSCSLDPRGGTIVSCRNRHLPRVPSGFPLNSRSIDLSRNEIEIIRNGTFRGLHNLTELFLNDNNIASLESNSFADCGKLLQLKLSSNNLSMNYDSFPEHVFQPLVHLQKLYLEGNTQQRQGDYPDKIFKPLQNLLMLKIHPFDVLKFGEGFQELKSLRVLHITNGRFRCFLDSLENDTFEIFREIALRELYISRCSLHHVHSGTFQLLVNLKILDLSHNLIGVRETLQSLKNFRSRNMTAIIISRVARLVDGPDDCMITNAFAVHIARICVENFFIDRNYITFMNLNMLMDSEHVFHRCIRHLDLSNNRMINVEVTWVVNFHPFPNLEYFDVSNQYGVSQNLESQEAINTIKIASNMNEPSPNTRTQYMYLPPKLKYMLMSQFQPNHVTFSVDEIVMVNATNLIVFDISYISLEVVSSRIKGLEHLRILNISGNPFTNLPLMLFDTFPSLESVYLNKILLGNEFIFNHGNRLFSPLTNLLNLYLQNNNLKRLPNNFLMENRKLNVLDLSFNSLTNIVINQENLPHLSDLRLRFNAITYLDVTTRENLNRRAKSGQFKLSLDGNIFSCGCESWDFLLWLKMTEVQLDKGGNYSCLSEEGHLTYTSLVSEHSDVLWRRCVGKTWLMIAMLGLFLQFIAFLLCFITKRFWTNLIHFILTFFGHRYRMKGRTEFDYDLFVIYANCEYEWPCEKMFRNLEQHPQRRIHMYFKDRDDYVGEAIATSLINGVHRSWKTVMIFTDAFVRDAWCVFGMRTAIYSIYNYFPHRVIFLRESQTDISIIPKELINVLDEDDVMDFSWNVNDSDVFWEKLYDLIIR